MLLTQKVAFNSPVWFNVGCDRLEPFAAGQNWHWDPMTGGVVHAATGYKNPQCSACFINSVDDSMEGIMDLARTEALLSSTARERAPTSAVFVQATKA